MSRLDFCNVNVQMREKELGILKEAYSKVSDSKCKCSEVVLIEGASGTGKSTLVQQLKSWIETTQVDGSYFVTGKFDQQRSAEPYYAVVTAFNELCELVMKSSDKDRARTSFLAAVGSKGKILLDIVPQLNRLLGDIEDDVGARGTTTALNQVKFVFRAFVHSLTAVSNRPIVFVMDDLQWADVPSLELMKSLMSDTKTTQMLVVGSYRDNEVDETHPFYKQIRDVEDEKAVQRIRLGNLSVPCVNDLIANLTELREDETLPLSEIVHHKTNGNVFFVIQFLRMLEEDKLIHFSTATFKWTWDLEQINAETDLADNVVDLVAEKIKRQPFKVRAALKFAACLWSTFDADLLEEVMKRGLQKHEEEYGSLPEQACSLRSEEDYTTHLDAAADEGLLDKLGDKRYKFAHDRIQQAAYSLLPEGSEREVMHNRIGEVLWEMTKERKREDWMYFAAADQMNRGIALINDERKKVELAQLNLLAGKKAIALSAFVPAGSYLSNGIDLLQPDLRWTKHFDLCLELFTLLASMEFCLGNADRTRILVEEVIANKRCCNDAFDALYTLGLSYVAQGKFLEARLLCRSLLRKVGERPPLMRKANRSFECYKLRRKLKMLTDSELLSLPMMVDPNKRIAMKFYDLAYSCAGSMGKLNEVAFVAMRMMRLTLQFGLSEQSPLAFATFGSALSANGDIQSGYRFGRLAMKLAESNSRLGSDGRIAMSYYCLLSHWSEPLYMTLDPLLEANKSGMLHGDMSWAFQCIVGYQLNYFFSGLPLSNAVEDLLDFRNLMKEYKQSQALQAQAPVLQLMLNLIGRSKDPLVLTGEVMDQADYESPEKNPSRAGLQAIDSCRMQLAYYFNDMELAAFLSRRLKRVSKGEVWASNYLICVRSMFFGLISIAIARTSKIPKHRRDARKIIALFEKEWVKKGAVNCLHKLYILKAEFATLDKESEEVKEAFDMAITTSRRAGFTQDEALANESAARYFLDEGDEFYASSYLSRAHEVYHEWGALAKCSQLEKRHGALLTQSEEHRSSSNLRGRRRFSAGPSKKHHKIRVDKLVKPTV